MKMKKIQWERESNVSIAERLGVNRRKIGKLRKSLGFPVFRMRQDTLREIVFEHVSRRQPKTFQEVYYDVINDWGSVTERHVYRVIADLLEERKIACVTAPRRNRRVAGKAQLLGGVYLRMESPLLWDVDGYLTIIDMANVGDPYMPLQVQSAI